MLSESRPTREPAPVSAGPRYSPPIAWLSRIGALIGLTFRESVRSRALLGMAALMLLFGFAFLLWPADVDQERVILVQRFCYSALTLFGLIAAVFLGGASLPREISAKRIYGVATKPVRRLDILLGKTIGLMCVLLAFLIFGGIVTFVVTHIASARKSFAGGSYTAEIVAESVDVSTADEPLRLVRGQVLQVEGVQDNEVKVSVPSRYDLVRGRVPRDVVEIHERSLRPRRVIASAIAGAMCQARAEFVRDELVLWFGGPAESIFSGELAAGERWSFDLSALGLPQPPRELPVRVRFGRLRHEPYGDPRKREPPQVTFAFRAGANNPDIVRRVDFTFVLVEHRPVPEMGQPLERYEGMMALPAELLAGPTLEVAVTATTPAYPETGRTFYTWRKTPEWTVRGLDPSDLPDGLQTVEAHFLVQNIAGLDMIDSAALTAVVRNPASGESGRFPIVLRNQTTSFLRFPRTLIDAKEGVAISFVGLGKNLAIGHLSKEAPLYLVLTPGSFAATTARAVLLTFLYLALFAVFAVAVSTFVSAPVAILFAIVAALSGTVKGMILTTRTAAELAPPWQAAADAVTLQDRIRVWVEYFLTKLLVWLAPSPGQFSTAEYLNRGWAVPWEPVWRAASYALPYAFVCFLAGYLLFAWREFE